MLTHPTLDQLHHLGLHGMAKAFADIEAGGEAASLGHAEWLALLLRIREACTTDPFTTNWMWQHSYNMLIGVGTPRRSTRAKPRDGGQRCELNFSCHNLTLIR